MLLTRLPLRRFAYLFLPVLLAAGCGPRAEITQYTAPKPERLATNEVAAPAEEQQTLGAIVLVDATGWFFKLTGPKAKVAAQQEGFDKLVRSLTFAGTGRPEPKWELPAGWSERPGSGLRFSTIDIPTDGKPLELTVIPLDKSGDTAEYVLSNVNRWRDQLALPKIGVVELAKTTTTIKLGDYDCTLVTLTGTGSGTMSGAPFAPFAGGQTPPSGPAPAAGPTDDSPLAYEKPAGWTAGQQNQFSTLAFDVRDEGKSVLITVSELGPAAGDVLQNVNRWRGQVGLAPTTLAELTPTLKAVDTFGTQGDFVVLAAPEDASPRKALLGIIAATRERVWFVKLIGDHDLALREKDNFEAFAKSLKQK